MVSKETASLRFGVQTPEYSNKRKRRREMGPWDPVKDLKQKKPTGRLKTETKSIKKEMVSNIFSLSHAQCIGRAA